MGGMGVDDLLEPEGAMSEDDFEVHAEKEVQEMISAGASPWAAAPHRLSLSSRRAHDVKIYTWSRAAAAERESFQWEMDFDWGNREADISAMTAREEQMADEAAMKASLCCYLTTSRGPGG